MASYIVCLEDFPEITERHKAEAETRFRRTLERALGGVDEVPPAYRAWRTAEEAGEYELSEEDAALARRWIAAALRARNDGFNGLGEAPEAYFDIRLAR